MKCMKKILNLLLCILMVATSFRINVRAENNEVNVYYGSQIIDNVTLLQNEKITLSVEKSDDATYQWQLACDEYHQDWVNIYGQDRSYIILSYAMVKSLVDQQGITYLRCIKNEEISNIVKVEVVNPEDHLLNGDTVKQPNKLQSPLKKLTNTVSNQNDNYESYSVVIEYKYEDGTVAFDSYAASIEKGGSFNTTVAFPTIVGYLPYFGENSESTESYTIDLENVTENITYTVTYKPTTVKYTVIHMLQNALDDNYEEFEKEEKYGLTGSEIYKCEKDITGFTSLNYEKIKIAADGSTEVVVYYDRNYYLLNFNLDGGYGVEPIYARYGTPINDVGIPKKAGYEFGGWLLNDVISTIPTTIPAENREYKASWIMNDTAKVTIVFWGENADNEDYSYIYSKEIDVKSGSEYIYTVCTKEEHKHTKDCYSNVGNEVDENYLPDNATNGQIYRYRLFSSYKYYIYIDGTWHEYNGKNVTDGQIVKPDKCNKEEHTHTVSCYGMDGNLWKFIKSDKVIVEADGSTVVNVYYDRKEFTLTFNYDYGRNYNKVKTITAKWGANISEEYQTIADDAGSTYWSKTSNGNSPWTGYFGIMPQSSATYYNNHSETNSGVMTYYGQDLNGDYKIKLYEEKVGRDLFVTEEDLHEFKGFTYDNGTAIGKNCVGAKFYYTRNSYDLTFNDGYRIIKSEKVKYEDSLGKYDFIPEVPVEYESGSVEFGGWYLNPECTGAQYILSEHNMDADNLILYAKWTLVTHVVEFYLNETNMINGIKLPTHPDKDVLHGHLIGGSIDIPENGRYSFIGWFYKENGIEKAFDFADMPITKDMKVYAKWNSNVLVNYIIHYTLEDGTAIADDTNGSALAGSSKTFTAKTGDELYDLYKEGYYPYTNSHALLMDINNVNEFTFVYKQMDAVPYTVRYVDKQTGEQLIPSKTVSDNKKAVVTETFVRIEKYMPDAYQKRLVLSADESQNIITFYYTKDSEHAYYIIKHWVQNVEGDAYTEYRAIENSGDIGQLITENPLSLKGYTYNSLRSNNSGTITADGLELNLYYDRNTYPYTVKYLEYGTEKELYPTYTSAEKYRFGKVVSANAVDIAGYTLYGEKIKTKTINDTGNEIIFYYTEQDVVINYVVIEQGYGRVSQSRETIKAFTGTASGSTAIANDKYRFVGWYLDEQCTLAVDASWVDGNNKLVPQRKDGLNVSTTYYAKFVANVADLTIKKNGNQLIDDKQTYLFRIQGTDEFNNDIDITVVIHGDGEVTIKDLLVGNYTVTEFTDWSFRYKPDKESKDVKLSVTGSSVSFNNERKMKYWLDGNNYLNNLFNNN